MAIPLHELKELIQRAKQVRPNPDGSVTITSGMFENFQATADELLTHKEKT